MSISAGSRTRLAAQQATLISALVDGGEPPGAFDAAGLRASALALALKRERAAARAWPELTQALGEQFHERFAAYAAATALPRIGGSLADGRAFAHWLAAQGDLPESARLEVLAVDLRYLQSAEGLIRRKGAAFKAVYLHSPRRLVLAIRLPWLGERWLRFQLWKRSEGR